MQDQLTLFDINQYDITPEIERLKLCLRDEPWVGFIREGWHPIKLDNVDRIAIVFGISRQTVLNTYENFINEQLSYNSENQGCPCSR